MVNDGAPSWARRAARAAGWADDDTPAAEGRLLQLGEDMLRQQVLGGDGGQGVAGMAPGDASVWLATADSPVEFSPRVDARGYLLLAALWRATEIAALRA